VIVARLVKHAFAVFGLVYMTGALVFMLTPKGADEAPMVQLLGIVIGLVSAGSLLLMRGPARLPLQAYAPLAVILTFAALSTLWAVDFQLSVRRTGALVFTAMFAVWFVESFRVRTLMNLLVAALLLVCLASFVAIFALPEFGIHQDVEKTFAGAWRGVYMHKNDLGILVALAILVFVVQALLRRRFRLFYVICIGLAAVLTIGSQSAQAVVLAILCAGTAVLAVFLRQRTPAERAMALLFLIPFSFVVYVVSEYLSAQLLLTLGKDPTLSARTEIWEVVLKGLEGHLLLGGGYGTGWALVDDPVLQYFGREMGHAHNGFLQLTIDIGIAGMLLFTAVFIYTGVLAFTQFMRGRHTEFACFWLTYQVFFLVGNMANSFVLEYNSLATVLFVVALRLLQTPQASIRNIAAPAPPAMAGATLSSRIRTVPDSPDASLGGAGL